MAGDREQGIKRSESVQRKLVPVTPNAIISALQGRSSVGDLMATDPAFSRKATNLAYHNPGLFEERPVVRPELSAIRRDFPDTIQMFGNERVMEALSRRAPSMASRLTAERQMLEQLPEEDRVGIKDIELVLRTLMEEGSPEAVTQGTILNALTAQEGYIALLESLQSSGDQLSVAEEKKFIEIGQNIGRNVRTMNVDETVLDADPNLPRGEQDYRGRIAQLRALSRVITRLSEEGGHRDEVDRLLHDYQGYAVSLGSTYPDRAVEIKRIAGLPGMDYDRLAAYVPEPGAADMTRAEITDFNHGGR